MVNKESLWSSLCDLIHIDMTIVIWLYSYTQFDEFKCYNYVSFKLGSLLIIIDHWGAEYRCSHSSPIYFKMLLAYYCDTQKQSSEEFAKFIGKQLYWSPFSNKVARARPIKKRDSNTVLFKGYLRYRTITSQIVSSEAQFKNFFIS